MGKVVGILQPGYLPWLGFFEQMHRSGVFVMYDDVQYDKNGWRNRNRIKTPKGASWLTVPVKASISLNVNEVPVDNSQPWARKQLMALRTHYGKAEYFNEYFPVFEKILSQNWEKLIDLDMALIREINGIIGLEREIVFSSKLPVEGDREGRLINICKHFGADTFYEGAAGKNYIDEKRFSDAGIKVEFQDYNHPVYHQLHGDFVSHLSIIDLIFNEGGRSLEIITKK